MCVCVYVCGERESERERSLHRARLKDSLAGQSFPPPNGSQVLNKHLYLYLFSFLIWPQISHLATGGMAAESLFVHLLGFVLFFVWLFVCLFLMWQ